MQRRWRWRQLSRGGVGVVIAAMFILVIVEVVGFVGLVVEAMFVSVVGAADSVRVKHCSCSETVVAEKVKATCFQ